MLPEAIADHRYERYAAPVIVASQEQAPDGGLQTEHLVEGACNECARNSRHRPWGANIEDECAEPGHAGKDVGVCGECADDRI